MAYFGRKVKKPGSTPGAGSGFVDQQHIARVSNLFERAVSQPRQSRSGRVVRNVRNLRAGRKAR